MRQFLVGAGLLGTLLACATPVRAEADPVGDTFTPNSIDITDLSACQSATSLVIDVAFAAAITPPAGDPPPSNALFGYIDLDLDANPETGNVSHLESYGPPGPGTELGIEGALVIPDWDPVTQTIRFEPLGAEDTRVPIVFTTNAIRVTVPLTPGWAPSIHLGTIIGNFDDPTDAAPNTGYVGSTACCGNGRVDPGEDCDGDPCCTSTCTFAEGATCDDDDACTVSDTCAAGQCGGSTRDCDDGDPCYDDGCDAASGCAHVNRTGFPGVTCAFTRARPTLCAGQTVVTAKLDKARTAVTQAATATGAKQKKLIKKARTALKAMSRSIARAQKKDKLTSECANGLSAQVDDIGKRLDAAIGG